MIKCHHEGRELSTSKTIVYRYQLINDVRFVA